MGSGGCGGGGGGGPPPDPPPDGGVGPPPDGGVDPPDGSTGVPPPVGGAGSPDGGVGLGREAGRWINPPMYRGIRMTPTMNPTIPAVTKTAGLQLASSPPIIPAVLVLTLVVVSVKLRMSVVPDVSTDLESSVVVDVMVMVIVTGSMTSKNVVAVAVPETAPGDSHVAWRFTILRPSGSSALSVRTYAPAVSLPKSKTFCLPSGAKIVTMASHEALTKTMMRTVSPTS